MSVVVTGSAGGGGLGGAREASSEGSPCEATPDTDDSGGDTRHRAKRRHHPHPHPHRVEPAAKAPQPHTHSPRSLAGVALQPAGAGVQVAALEVQNVKRAINRYGTLPKGARIGAYLESLRQSGAPPSPCAAGGGGDEARSLSPRTGRAAPHMIRSNSSGGVTGPRASPAKPRPRLADLDFPPPPPDLPPAPPAPPALALPASAPVLPASPVPAPPVHAGETKRAMKEMLELKLVAEIKERADRKRHRAKESPPESPPPAPRLQDPVTRLVSELSESLQLEPVELKASLRKTWLAAGADYKAQLKKVDVQKKEGEEAPRALVDLKARLRRVESAAPAPAPEEPSAAADDDEDKRRSTGSISSLKKLWESKETEERLSPKPGEAAGKVRKPPGAGGIYASPQAARDDDDDDLLAALRVSLDCTTNEVTSTPQLTISDTYT